MEQLTPTELPVTGLDGASASTVVALHNATILAEQQRLLERAEADRALFEGVLKQLPAGLIVTEAPSGRTLLTNSYAGQILGYPPVGCQSLEDFKQYTGVHADGRPFELNDYAHVRSLTRGEVVIDQRSHFVRGDGSPGVLSVSSAPIRDRTGTIIAAVCAFFDATGEERVRDELAHAKDAAEAANAAKDQFLAVLSHELRTPLTPVLALLSTLDDRNDLSDSLREDLGIIRRNVELEARLIDDLLDLTRVSRGKLELNLEPVDVHELIHAALQTCCRDDMDSKKVEVTLALEARRHRVRGDAARLQQVFWNLLGNAVKFSPGGGTINVRSFDADGRLRIEISDHGIGIEPEVLPRIFNAFEQGEQSTARRFGGLGLGLAICRAIIQLHGGAITARSGGPGTGATFAVELSLCEAPPVQPPPPADAPANAMKTAHVLLVEDHADTARIMARLLDGKGYRLTTAGTLADALHLSGQQAFDVLISDLGLPDGSGLELITQIHRSRRIPAIALSGFGMDEDIDKSKAAGFSEHLTKPVNFQSLLNAINRLLS